MTETDIMKKKNLDPDSSVNLRGVHVYQEEEDTGEEDPFLRRLSKRLDQNARWFFFRLGYWIAEHPKLTVLISLLGVAIASLGALQYDVGDGGEREWVPGNTVSIDNLDRYDLYFPDDSIRVNQIVITNRAMGDDMATRRGVLDLVEVLEKVESITWEGYSFDDVCKIRIEGSLELCLTNSVLDLFFSSSAETIVYKVDGVTPSFTATVRAVVEGMDDDQVKSIIFDDYATQWTGDDFVPDLFLGTIDANSDYIDNTSPALKLNVVLIDTSEKDVDASYEFESEIEDILVDSLELTGGSKIFVGTMGAQEDSGAAQASDVPLLMLGILLAVVYVCSALGHLNAVQSRVSLALLAIFSVVLAYIAMIGICSLISYYGPVHQLLPLLLVAIGVDDAFVIVSAFDELSNSDYGRSEKIARALSRAGAAITVTSCTNSFAFFMGSTTRIPALKWFAVWAGVGIFLDFLLMATFFVACLTFDAGRQDQSRRDMLCCFKVNSPSSKNVFGKEPEALRRFYEHKYAPFILKKSTSLVIILLTLSIFASSIYGMVNLELKFPDDALLTDGTAIKDFTDIQGIYFLSTNDVFPVEIFTGNEDYADEDIQKKMNLLFDINDGYVVSNKYFKDNTFQSWYNDFRKYGNLTDVDETFPTDSYYEKLLQFLESNDGTSSKDNLVFDGSVLVATRSFGALDIASDNANDRVDAMRTTEDSVSSAGLSDAFPVSTVFLWFERDAILYDEAVQILLVALATVFVITFLLIGNIQASLITLLGPCFSVVDMLGFMYYFEIDFNTVTIICLALSVGITIDFSSHVTIGFMSSIGSNYERVVGGLKHLGPPLFHAGVTTFICTGILVFSKTYVFWLFFQMFMMIISLGMFHGLVLVPIILLKMGPKGFFLEEGELEKTEDNIVNHVIGGLQ